MIDSSGESLGSLFQRLGCGKCRFGKYCLVGVGWAQKGFNNFAGMASEWSSHIVTLSRLLCFVLFSKNGEKRRRDSN